MPPLSVRIQSAACDRHVTHELINGPKFRSVVPGGFANCTFTLARPLGFTPQDVRHFAKVYVYSNHETVWEGWVEDLNTNADDSGSVWEITAVGPSAHASDDARPLIYSDSELSSERWQKGSSFSTKSADVSLGDDNVDGPIIVIKAAEGEAVYGGGTVYGDAMYRTIYDAGLKLARIRFTMHNGVTDSNYSNRIVTRQGPGGTGNNTASHGWTSGHVDLVAALGGSNPIPAGHDVAHIRWVRIASGDIRATSDNYWLEASAVNVRMQLKDKSGNDITSGYPFPSILASEVVEDLLGRCLPLYDGTNARVESTAYNIEHLCYPGGVTPAEVLEDLIEFEKAFYWAAWESGTNGKYRFEWRAWPQEVQYEADLFDGYQGPRSGAEIYNKALVRYIDWRGREVTRTVTQNVPSLTAMGRTRTIQVDSGNETSSFANAGRIGSQELEDHQVPLNAGTLNIARPIYNRINNRMVWPWEIRPGRLIRVRGVQPSTDALNTTVRDGVTTFKIVGVEYDADSGVAQLELDSHPKSTARYLARLAKAREQRRRRK